MKRKIILYSALLVGTILLLSHTIWKWKTYNEMFRENVKHESLQKQLVIQTNANHYIDSILLKFDELIATNSTSKVLDLLEDLSKKDYVTSLSFLTSNKYYEMDDKSNQILITEGEYNLDQEKSSISMEQFNLLLQIKRIHQKTKESSVLRMIISLPALFNDQLLPDNQGFYYAIYHQGVIVPLNFEGKNFPLPDFTSKLEMNDQGGKVIQFQQFTFTELPLFLGQLKVSSIQLYAEQISFVEYYASSFLLILFFIIVTYGIINYERKIKQLAQKSELQVSTLDRLLDNLPIGTVLINKKKRIKNINRVALSMFGANSKDELIGKHCNHTICSRKDGKCPILDLGEDLNHMNSVLLCSDSSEKPILKSAIRYFNDGEEMLLETFIDVSDIKKAEDTIIQSNIAKSLFLSNMSHEIRTPLHAIIGYSEMLSSENLSDDARKFLDIIYKSGKNLLQVISDILDITKIESGEFHLEKHPTDIYEIMQEMKDIFAYSMKEKKLNFDIQMMDHLPTSLMLDPSRTRQIFSNLISNAVKFTNAGSIKVKISYEQKSSQIYDLKIIVEDTGIGISKDKIDDVFRSFYQEDADITRKFGGTGLGLTLAKRIVETMEGTITVKSELNKGSEFSVYLPNIKKIEAHEHVQENIPDCSSKKVLVIEDNKTNQYLLKMILEKLGAKVLTACNGKDGLNIAQKMIPDIIFLDIKMPVMNGEEFLNEIVKDEVLREIPVIVLTASASKECRNRLHKIQQVHFLTKPVQKEQLFEIIRNLPTLPMNPEPNSYEFIETEEKKHQNTQSLDQLKEKWQDVSKSAILEDIRLFAIQLQETAEVNDLKEISESARVLIESIQDFDILQMKKEIEKINHFLK
jgi:signal transduction histidine kinase/CheY-like chemotaxis protein